LTATSAPSKASGATVRQSVSPRTITVFWSKPRLVVEGTHLRLFTAQLTTLLAI
jgi:hypothetical protein